MSASRLRIAMPRVFDRGARGRDVDGEVGEFGAEGGEALHAGWLRGLEREKERTGRLGGIMKKWFDVMICKGKLDTNVVKLGETVK
jgi:hypothetical protein